MAPKNTKKTESTEITTTTAPTTALAAPSSFEEFGEGEVLTKNDLLIKRYRIVQGMTRAKKDNKELRDGDIYDTLTKQGFSSCVVLNLREDRVIVEKMDDSTAKFVREMRLDDPRVLQAFKKNNNSFRDLKSIDTDPPTKFVDTYNVHVVFLEKDEEPCLEFGVLQFDGNNHTPRKQWMNDRVNAARNLSEQTKKPALPSFFFPSVVSTDDKQNVASGTESKIYKITPRGERWTEILNPAVPADYALLKSCKQHSELLKSGLFTVDYSGEDEEAGQEGTGYVDPENDGRETVTAPNEAPSF